MPIIICFCVQFFLFHTVFFNVSKGVLKNLEARSSFRRSSSKIAVKTGVLLWIITDFSDHLLTSILKFQTMLFLSWWVEHIFLFDWDQGDRCWTNYYFTLPHFTLNEGSFDVKHFFVQCWLKIHVQITNIDTRRLTLSKADNEVTKTVTGILLLLVVLSWEKILSYLNSLKKNRQYKLQKRQA